ncbi:hypothetical protein A4A49_07253 [Nicotiana attenuata]|uniref:Uncharacterized protein n=1 Tax=Nicotiana attenuata TaxID=49451 RepID=A0A314LAU3_NICAT|nr:hypothetical protein A4A49_07253 [Nicotiana attenuata]
MNQEECSSKNKKISNCIPAGSLASLQNQRVSSLTTKGTFQATSSNENEVGQSEGGLPSSLRNQKVSSLTTKTVLKEGQMRMKNDNPKVDLNCKNKYSKCHIIPPLQQHKEYMNKCNK